MKLIKASIVALTLAFAFASCVKQEYQAPPELVISQWDTTLPVNSGLKAITQSCLSMGSLGYRVLGDTTISGVVVADDRSGNFYKIIVIQDSTGGAIELYIDKSYLYNDYPVGRKLYVRLKGLYLVNYKGLPEICYSASGTSTVTTGAIPSALADSYIVKAKLSDTSVKAKSVTIEDVVANYNNYICNLVTINNVQFKSGSYGKVYAEFQVNTNRDVENCAHTSSIILRNSGYADFQPAITPSGNGSITGVVTAFYTTPQLLIRDTTDVKFNNGRCN